MLMGEGIEGGGDMVMRFGLKYTEKCEILFVSDTLNMAIPCHSSSIKITLPQIV
jgi:hypothetical protein